MADADLKFLHICHARQDETWVRGVLIPALGLEEGQYWTRAEDAIGMMRVDEVSRAVESCRYTLMVASSAARVDEWVHYAATLAQHVGLEEGRPRLIIVARDIEQGSSTRARDLALSQRFLVYVECNASDGTETALTNLARQLALAVKTEVPLECPYPGLRMFGEGDAGQYFNRTDLFFGRDSEGRDIVERLRQHRRVLLVGPSGCGKSSLVRARVLPALGQAAQAMAIAVARPGATPGASLRTAIEGLDPRLGPAIDAYLATDDQPEARTTLAAAVPSTGRRHLLYIDQFEEVFLDQSDDTDQRQRFFKTLTALDHVPSVAVLLGMRADFYGDLMRSPAWDGYKDHRVELAPLRGAALRLAIKRPAEEVGVYVETDLVERLVREADMDRASDALPLLQVALEQLWAHREWRYMSLESYARIAEDDRCGLDVVFARHADVTVNALDAQAQVFARRVLIDLVHLGEGRPDTRRRRFIRELRRADDDADALTHVLSHLAARRLITASAEASGIVAVQTLAPSSGESDPVAVERHVDLAHDTLITGWPELAGWITARRDDLRTQRRLEARASGGGLLAATELPEFTRWIAWVATPNGREFGASEVLRDLVKRSVASRRFRRRMFGVALVAATAFAVVFGLTSLRLTRATASLREEETKTERSISKSAETAELIVSEIDTKLRTLAGASSVRETLLARSRALLTELNAIRELSPNERRTEMANKRAQADFALERGQLEAARALYLDVLADALERAVAAPTNPDWQHDLSVVYQRLCEVAMTGGSLAHASRWLEQAFAIDRTLTAADPANTNWRRGLSLSYEYRGAIALRAGKLDEARHSFEQSRSIRELLAATEPANADWQQELLVSYRGLGEVAVQAGKLAEAENWFEQAHKISQSWASADPSNAVWRRILWRSHSNLGDVAVKVGKLDDARAWYERMRDASKALADADPANTEWQHDLATSYERLGAVELTAKKFDDARIWFEHSLAIGKDLAAMDPANTGWQRNLAVSYKRRGEVAVAIGQLDEAQHWFEQILATTKRLVAADPANARWRHDLWESNIRLGENASAAGRDDEASGWFQQALAVIDALAAMDPANAVWRRDLSGSYYRLGDIALKTGKFDEARGWFERAHAVSSALVAADPANVECQHDLTVSYVRLGEVALAIGELDEARHWFEKVWALTKSLSDADPASARWKRGLMVSCGTLGRIELRAGRFDDARGWFEQALAVNEALAAAEPANPELLRDRSVSLNNLGKVALKAGNLDDARSWFEKVHEIRKAMAVSDPADTGRQYDLSLSCDMLGDIALMTGEVADARSWFSQSFAIRERLAAKDSTNTDLQRSLLISCIKLGDVAVVSRTLGEARTWFEQALAIGETRAPLDKVPAAWQRDISVLHQRLGDVEEKAGRVDKARQRYKQALEVSRTLAAAEPANPAPQHDFINSLAEVARLAPDLTEATRYLDEARNVYERSLHAGVFQSKVEAEEINAELDELAADIARSRPLESTRDRVDHTW